MQKPGNEGLYWAIILRGGTLSARKRTRHWPRFLPGTDGFTGVLGVIHFRGTEYRLATYLGAKAVKIQDGELVIRQGDWPGKPRPGTFSGHRWPGPCTVSSGKAPAAMPSIPSG